MTEFKTHPITSARLDWDENGQPLSAEFGDVYFSRANGLEETRHVFLQHNQLYERWTRLNPGEVFTIAETGFGSGLNFLAAWQLWLELAPADAYLDFVSVELFPLSNSDLGRALALWPELKPLADQLIEQYPVMVEQGFQRLNFLQGRIRLTLIINDAAQGFNQLLGSAHPDFARHCAAIDAWFLDGFAPAKNPQMWSDSLFNAIGQLSRPGTTAATFSAAGIVRNGLKRVGFTVKKVPGFGRKREMVAATCEQTFKLAVDPNQNPNASLYPAPWAVSTTPRSPHKHALIIGGGLSGCTTARALAERGWQITLVEQHAQLAREGSGNPQGVVYAKLSPKNEPLAQFNLAALQYAVNYYRRYWDAAGSRCGVLQLAHDPGEGNLQQQLREKFSAAAELVKFVSREEASQIAGVELSQGGLYFPQVGWMHPAKLCAQLLDHPNINVLLNRPIKTLTLNGNQWHLRGENFSGDFPLAIIANARDARHFAQCQDLPIRSIRGQVSYLPVTNLSAPLKTVVCAEGYIAPAMASSVTADAMNHHKTEATHCCGATFNLREETRALRTEDHYTNLTNLAKALPELAKPWLGSSGTAEFDAAQLNGRVAFRCTLPDYLPMVGQVPNLEPMAQAFAALRKNARAAINHAGSYWPNLYINIGQGSRGLAYTPLCAELLAAQINGEVLPLSRELANALNPARFFIRDLIKNRR